MSSSELPEPLHSQGATFEWGTTSFVITSWSLDSPSNNSEIDITSMSSRTKPDPSNTNRLLVARDFDSCFSSEGGLELKVDILIDGSAGSPWSVVGEKRDLSIMAGTGGGVPEGAANFNWSQPAILTSFSGGASVGDFIKGSAVFKLTD